MIWKFLKTFFVTSLVFQIFKRIALHSWTSPQTWTATLVTVSDMNTHVRDNLLALKNPPGDIADINEAADYTTTSSTFTNIDGSDTEGILRHTITIAETFCWVWGNFTLSGSTSPMHVRFNITVNGTVYFADDGMFAVSLNTLANGGVRNVSFITKLTGLTAGSNIFRMQWKTSAGTATFYVGAGTSLMDVHPQFGVQEMS